MLVSKQEGRRIRWPDDVWQVDPEPGVRTHHVFVALSSSASRFSDRQY